MYRHGFNFEIQRLARREPGRDQIPDHFLLPIDHDAVARQLLEVDPVAAAGKVQKQTVMKQSFRHHPCTDTRLVQDVDTLVLEHAGTHAIFNVVTTFGFQHGALDAVLMQEVRQQKARRTRADDRNLGTHER
jgi:hypothetical protein